jgi:hypothetical protein
LVTRQDFAAQDHAKLRFENKTAEKMLKQAWTFFRLFYLCVTAAGFEPATIRAEI